MYVYVCMYICMYVCIYIVYTYICMYIYIFLYYINIYIYHRCQTRLLEKDLEWKKREKLMLLFISIMKVNI